MMRALVVAGFVSIGLITASVAAEYEKGDVIEIKELPSTITPGVTHYVDILNTEPLVTLSGKYVPGDICEIEEGGSVKVVGNLDDGRILVEYNDHTYLPHIFACEKGIIFAVSSDWLQNVSTSLQEYRYPAELREKVKKALQE